MKISKPTTPSMRHTTFPDRGLLHRGKPLKSHLKSLAKKSGRNSQGRITVRHQGGGAKQRYRLVDFKQDKLNVPGKIELVEYDPFRSGFILRVLYADGERRYHLAHQLAKIGAPIIAAQATPLETGNRLMLKNVPVGYEVFNIELKPGRGGQIVRSAGSAASVLAQESGYTHLRMPSGEVRKVLWTNFASLGRVSNSDNKLVNIGKAGRSRHLGIRPTVRGTAMNPVDHPYGGGEGRQPRGLRKPKTAWGKITGGRKTRTRKKWSNSLILRRRPKKSKK
ncbi:MAG TPA: 50S ribosomal protein L2 [Candidatus Tyrphobacter sp.]|nr:50S ribosomal protein L2 [Candidatus Tyrphobacter sp.]